MARSCSLWPWAAFAISSLWVSGGGLMKFLLQSVEVAAVLVPDFLTLGLVGPAFFSVYCILRTLDLVRTVDTDLALGISLAMAYLVTIALNISTPLLTPARSRITASAESKSKTKPQRSESPQGTRKAESVEHGGALIKS